MNKHQFNVMITTVPGQFTAVVSHMHPQQHKLLKAKIFWMLLDSIEAELMDLFFWVHVICNCCNILWYNVHVAPSS